MAKTIGKNPGTDMALTDVGKTAEYWLPTGEKLTGTIKSYGANNAADFHDAFVVMTFKGVDRAVPAHRINNISA